MRISCRHDACMGANVTKIIQFQIRITFAHAYFALCENMIFRPVKVVISLLSNDETAMHRVVELCGFNLNLNYYTL